MTKLHTIGQTIRSVARTGRTVFLRAQKTCKWDGELVLGWVLLIGLSVVGFGLQKTLSTPINCRVDSAYPAVTSNSDLRMTVKTGMSCAVAVRSGDAMLDEINVISPPRQGTIVARGRTGVTYRPERNFRGEDSFAFKLHGKTRAREFDTIVKVAVMVD